LPLCILRAPVPRVNIIWLRATRLKLIVETQARRTQAGGSLPHAHRLALRRIIHSAACGGDASLVTARMPRINGFCAHRRGAHIWRALRSHARILRVAREQNGRRGARIKRDISYA